MLSAWEEEEQLGPGAEQEALAAVRARRVATITAVPSLHVSELGTGVPLLQVAPKYPPPVHAGVLGVMQQWEGLCLVRVTRDSDVFQFQVTTVANIMLIICD